MERWLQFAILILTNISLFAFAYGRMSQRVDEVDKRTARLETVDNQLFDMLRQHEHKDFDHHEDADMHWNKRERDGLKNQLDVIEVLVRERNSR